jgi:hypothetical protein
MDVMGVTTMCVNHVGYHPTGNTDGIADVWQNLLHCCHSFHFSFFFEKTQKAFY